MSDELVERLRGIIVQVSAERDRLKASNMRLSGALYDMTAERDRLWEALTDAREAWDNHMEYGEPMQGWWVADASAALKGETT